MAKRESDKTRIIVDERIMVGKPIIKGTRITVEAVIRRLAEGMTIKELLKEYPKLKQKDVMAALEYAANIVSKEEIIPRVKAYA